VAVPLQGIYSASKHAIKGFTDSLRAELAHDDVPVSVTLIKPAAINTPYAEHAKNYLPDQPTHVPPVYSPRSVARAILYAAEHPAREVVVGAAGKALTLAEAVAPWIVDVFLSRVLLPSMHSGRPPHGRPALDGPTEDLREEGDYPGVVRPSLYTALRTRPGLASALVGAGAAVLMAARAQSVRGRLHSRLAGRRRPNTRESAVRAAQ
jgi:hypothetical protein